MSVRKPARRRNLSQADRREQLLDAALSAFTEGGYDATHVEHVVKAAGVSRGTFYLHFKSKHEVFEALVDRMLALFLTARPLEALPEIQTFEDAEQALRTSYRTVFEVFHEHRRLARLLFDEAIGINKGFRAKLEHHYRDWHVRVTELIDVLVDRGIARRSLDVEVTGEMVIGIVERLARRYLFQDPDADLDRLVEALVAFELCGVCEARQKGV